MLMTPAKARPHRDLGRRVAGLRARLQQYGPRGMSQRELADAAGVSPGYIPRIESGELRPTPEVLRRIADALETDYQELAVLARYSDQEEGDTMIAVDPEKAPVLRRLNRQLNRSQLERLESVWRMLVLGQEPAGNEAADAPHATATDAEQEHQAGAHS